MFMSPGDSVTHRVVLHMTNLDARLSESMVRDVHVAKVESSCIPVCPWILHWTPSIAQAFAILHCCIMSTNSENRCLSLLRPGDVGRLKSGVFMDDLCIMTLAGNVLTRIGYHHWRSFNLYIIDCRPHQAFICIRGSLSVPGYGRMMSRIGKSQVVFESAFSWHLDLMLECSVCHLRLNCAESSAPVSHLIIYRCPIWLASKQLSNRRVGSLC
jgi:hypothetical protein